MVLCPAQCLTCVEKMAKRLFPFSSEVLMYAIIEAGGKQFRVQEGNKIVVDRMAAEAGEEVTFDRVLMLGGESAKIGAPVVEGARVVARVIEHFRGEKIRVFKKRRRKGSMRTQGHRQDYTALTVTAINA